MARTRESGVSVKGKGAFALSGVVSEESLVAIREHILSLTPKRKGVAVPYELALWESRAWRALKGNRDAQRAIDRILYGWVEKDSAMEERIAAALGVSLDVARQAVALLQSSEQRDPHVAALGATQLLLWYTRTQSPIDRRVSDGIRQAAAQCEREVVAGDGPELQEP